MPNPNFAPPTIIDRHISRDAAQMLFDASSPPSATMALKPIIATPMASTHLRMRAQSPIVTMSASVPMVQNWVRRAIAPNNTDSPNAAPSTCVPGAFKSTSCIEGFYEPEVRRRRRGRPTSRWRAGHGPLAPPRTSGTR